MNYIIKKTTTIILAVALLALLVLALLSAVYSIFNIEQLQFYSDLFNQVILCLALLILSVLIIVALFAIGGLLIMKKADFDNKGPI